MKKNDFRYGSDPYGRNERERRSEDISGVVENLSRPKTMAYAILSMVIGAASLAISGFGGWFGLGLSILAIVFSIVSRRHLGYFDGKSLAGLVLGICGAVSSIASIVLLYLLRSGALDAFLEAFFEEMEQSGAGGDLL